MTQRRSYVRGLVLGAWFLAALAFIVWQGSESLWTVIGLEPSATEAFEAARSLRAAGRLDRAHEAVDEALRKAPGTAAYLTFEGYLELRQNRPDSAVGTFRRALNHDASLAATFGLAEAFLDAGRPDSARARLAGTLGALTTDGRLREDAAPEDLKRRAQLWARAGRSERALRDLSALLRVRPDDPALLATAISHAEATQNWERALALSDRLSEAAATSRGRRDANQHRARALRALGRAEEAYAAYAGVASSANLEARARLALRLERYETAASLYEDLVERAPQTARYRRALAYALQRTGRSAEAEAQYRALLESGTATPQSRVRYAYLLNEERRYQRAWAVLRVLDRPADEPSVHRLQANTAYWAGRYRDASSLLRAWVETHPADSTALHRLGRSREQVGDLEGALGAYRRAVAASASPAAGLLRRVARLYRQRAELDSAIRWYERCQAAEAPGAQERSRCTVELARVHLEAGAPQESLEALRPLVEQGAPAPDHLRLAARAATAANRPGRAARYLERLSRQEALSPEERRWLAGQLRASGRDQAALRQYEALLREGGRPPSPVLEATADLLRRVRGERAEALRRYRAALRRLRDTGADTSAAEVRLKVVRTAAEAGRDSTALAAYEAFAAANPRRADTLGLPIDLARRSLAVGRTERAADWARQAVRRDTAASSRSQAAEKKPLYLSLARSYLAQERPDEALRWARRVPGFAAVDRGGAVELRLLRAQILRQQGQLARAEEHFRALDTGPTRAEALAGRARIAEARDELLRAFRLFGRALEAGAPRPARLWLSRGRVAHKRGDYRRARAAYRRAEALEEDLPGLAGRRSAVRAATRPSLSVPFSTFQDNNGLSVRRADASGALWVHSGAELTASIFRKEARQGAGVFDGWGTTLAADHLFPTPAYRLRGQLRYETYGGGRGVLGGRLAATRTLEGGAEAGVAVARESLPGIQDLPSLRGRQFNRIVDLRALSPTFTRTELRGRVEVEGPGPRRLRVEPGAARYDDGNTQLFLYSHYQVPLTQRDDAWLALRPNLYVETFSAARAPYYTPRPGGSLGVTGHTIRRFSDWTLEVEVNPHLAWARREIGTGGHARLRARTQVGPLTISGVLFGLYEARGREYALWRASGGISYTLPH